MNKSQLKDYLLFNRNILIGFAGAFLTGAGISQAISRSTSPLVNSLISIVAERVDIASLWETKIPFLVTHSFVIYTGSVGLTTLNS